MHFKLQSSANKNYFAQFLDNFVHHFDIFTLVVNHLCLQTEQRKNFFTHFSIKEVSTSAFIITWDMWDTLRKSSKEKFWLYWLHTEDIYHQNMKQSCPSWSLNTSNTRWLHPHLQQDFSFYWNSLEMTF